MHDADLTAISGYMARSEHRSRVSAATNLILDVHTEAIERLKRRGASQQDVVML